MIVNRCYSTPFGTGRRCPWASLQMQSLFLGFLRGDSFWTATHMPTTNEWIGRGGWSRLWTTHRFSSRFGQLGFDRVAFWRGWNMIELMSWGHKALLHTLLVTVRMCLTYSYRVEQHRQLVKLPSWVRGVHLISKCAIVENKFQSETGLQHVCGLFSCSAFLRIATNAVSWTLTERWAKTSQPWAIDRGGPMIDLKGRA